MANSVKDVAFNELGPIVSELGYVLVDVEYIKRPNGMNLNLFIDGENGIDLDGLEKVHRAVDLKLDELDPTNGAPYTLNCSSLGLDRPITTDYQFFKAIGTEVEVKLYEAIKPQNIKCLEGTLIDFEKEEIKLNIKINVFAKALWQRLTALIFGNEALYLYHNNLHSAAGGDRTNC